MSKKISIAQNLYFFVLGDCILTNLKNIISFDKLPYFHVIDHPYMFSQMQTPKERDNKKLQIGTVGTLSLTKGAKHYLELLTKLPKSVKDNIHFSLIGKGIDCAEEFVQFSVDLPNKQEFLNRLEFEKKIDKLDIVLFFYGNSQYKLTASGAVFDAINREKPIIAMRNDYFEYLFKKFGTFGILVDDIDNMAIIIEEIAKLENFPIPIRFKTIKERLSIKELMHPIIKVL